MPTSTNIVFVVLWDQAGYGPDTLLGVFWDELAALEGIDKTIHKFGKRYVREDFKLIEKEVE